MCVEDSQKSEKSRAALKLKMKSHRTFISSGSFAFVLSSLCYISMTTGRKPHSIYFMWSCAICGDVWICGDEFRLSSSKIHTQVSTVKT